MARIGVEGRWLRVGRGEFSTDGLQGGGEGVQAMENSAWRQGGLLVQHRLCCALFQLLMRISEGWEQMADLGESWNFCGCRSWLWQARTQG